LDGTTKNVSPQKFETHPTLRQHRTHLRKAFHLKFISKDYPNHIQLETLIIFAKNLILIFQINGQRKCFKKMTLGVPLFKSTKGTWFSTFSNAFDF